MAKISVKRPIYWMRRFPPKPPKDGGLGGGDSRPVEDSSSLCEIDPDLRAPYPHRPIVFAPGKPTESSKSVAAPGNEPANPRKKILLHNSVIFPVIRTADSRQKSKNLHIRLGEMVTWKARQKSST